MFLQGQAKGRNPEFGVVEIGKGLHGVHPAGRQAGMEKRRWALAGRGLISPEWSWKVAGPLMSS